MVTFLIGWLLVYVIWVFGVLLIGAALNWIFKGIDEDDMWKVVGGAVLGIVTVVGLKYITEKQGGRGKQLHSGDASSTALQKRS